MSKKVVKKGPAKTEVKKIEREFVNENELIEKVKKDLKSFQYLTPSILTNKYNVSLGVSKRVLRKLTDGKVLKLASSNPRAPLYIVSK